jgi:hypothetical protein
MNEFALELAKKHEELLVLRVEAEEQADIADSFDVESVPVFVVLRVRISILLTGATSAENVSAGAHSPRPSRRRRRCRHHDDHHYSSRSACDRSSFLHGPGSRASSRGRDARSAPGAPAAAHETEPRHAFHEGRAGRAAVWVLAQSSRSLARSRRRIWEL